MATEYGNLPFDLAIQWFLQKLNIPARHWDDIIGQLRDRAFTVAGTMNADILMDFRNMVDAAIEDGISLQQFRSQFDETVEKYGWTYTGTRNWRSQLIYETNIRSAYAQGRYQQQMAPEMIKRRPYLQYRLGDVATRHREEHEKWDRIVLPADDPWWDTHYPPNGFG